MINFVDLKREEIKDLLLKKIVVKVQNRAVIGTLLDFNSCGIHDTFTIGYSGQVYIAQTRNKLYKINSNLGKALYF